MRFSVVINTYNRAASLRATLDALQHQTHPDFEVVVVDGPSDDGTAELLAERAGAVRSVRFEERNLSISRNLGIEAAAGEVVAFIDDDAIPEARWLEDLRAAYDAPEVGGAGGLTLDNTGTRVQYRYSVCSRIGVTDFDRRPPFDRFNQPGADPYLYLQGTNASFRRSALAEVEGFDEEIEYNYDESEVCSRIIDAGYRLRALERAVVHHKFLPSHMRRAAGFTDPFLPIKNRVYFALRVGREYQPEAHILASLMTYIEEVKDWAKLTEQRNEFSQSDLDHFIARADAGFAVGLERGLAGARKGRTIAPADPDAFRPYPTTRPQGRRLAVCFVTIDYPPKPIGGIARFTHDLARGFAAAGHEAHVVTRDDERAHRTDFEDGVWVHRFPVADRFIPELEGHPLKGNLDHLAAVNGAVARIAERVPLDVVSGSLWIAEPLLCALDPARATSVACNTPMAKVAELQPETAAAPLTPHQIRLEQALLRSPAQLQPVSEENAALCRTVTDRPMEVIWHGVADRRAEHPGRRSQDGLVEILFVGRLEPRKGIDTLLEAATALLRDHPQVRLRVCGGDNPHANGRPDVFTDWVAAHAADVADRIAFAGAVDDAALFDAYAGADVFCAPSRYESFGLVHVEAMMMGLPVVACDIGGMRETVVDGETGALVAPGDAAALRAALEPLVTDADLRARQGAAGRARYEAEFGLDVAVGRNVALYERLAAAPPRAGSQAEAVAAMLTDVCDLADAGAAAAALLDPSRFPEDPETALRAALGRPQSADFVTGAFLALLDRLPEAISRDTYVHRINTEGRLAIAAEIATSDEARARGIHPEVVGRLPEVEGPAVARELVGAALMDDDAAFAASVARIVAPGDWQARLTAGAGRAGVVREALALPAARRRIAGTELIDPDALHTAAEVVAELSRLRGDDRAFVAAAFRLLLGRTVDDAGAARFVGLLRSGLSHATVAHEIATSSEAAGRGVPTTAADRIARDLSAPSVRRPWRVVTRPLQRRRAAAPARAVSTETRLAQAIERAADPAPLDQRLAEHAAARAREASAVGEHVSGLREVQEDHTAALERSTNALGLLQRQVDVLTRKHEAMAMDLRDRLPATAPVEAAEPQILDPDGLTARVEALGGLRLNVGCGEKPLPDYVNVDFRPLPGVDVVADAARLPFAEGTVDEVASHHLIEHFRQHYAATVLLPYWRSLLRPDGVLRVVTPNWAVLMEHLQSGRLSFQQFKQVTFGLQDYSGDDHFALYSAETLTDLLRQAGFGAVEVLEERRQNGLSPELEVVAARQG